MATDTLSDEQQAGLGVRGLVLDLDKFATHDGPGIRTAVYLKGCPLRCRWCHSPESRSFRRQVLFLERKCTGCGRCLDVCPEGALRLIERASAPADAPAAPSQTATLQVDWSRCANCGECAAVCYPGALKMAGEWQTVGQVAAEVEKDRAFFDASGGGVTVTGGEVALQSEFATSLLRACRSRGIHTAVETSGYADWDAYQALARVTDLFLYDLKQMDEDRHRELTGVSNRRIHANLRRLAAEGARVVVRVPCVPELTDSAENVAATAAFARELGLSTIHLLPYNASAGAKYLWLGQPYGLSGLTTQSVEKMESLAEICRAQGLEVQIGG